MQGRTGERLAEVFLETERVGVVRGSGNAQEPYQEVTIGRARRFNSTTKTMRHAVEMIAGYCVLESRIADEVLQQEKEREARTAGAEEYFNR